MCNFFAHRKLFLIYFRQAAGYLWSILFISTGVSETLVLNMTTLLWSVVTTVQGRVPVASEVRSPPFC